MTDTAARWVVSGRVQGVGFRWFAMKTASRIGLTGWVRNQPDGTVEVVAHGSPGALQDMENAITKGPPFSRVESAKRDDVSPEITTLKSFEIR